MLSGVLANLFAQLMALLASLPTIGAPVTELINDILAIVGQIPFIGQLILKLLGLA